MSKLASLVVLLATALLAQAAPPAPQVFPSAEAGASALVAALAADDQAGLRAILGRRGVDLIGLRKSADPENPHERFLSAYRASHRIVAQGDAKAVLEVGADAWPFPIPLVKESGGWRFDAVLGEREVLARRIGRNELAAIQVCLAIADAQREYAASEHDGERVLKYAARFVSTPGRHDGLYWESAAGEATSPLGPFVAAAGIDSGAPAAAPQRRPYHGYYYRILTRQGAHAKGGAYSYVAGGKMIGGFAVAAYPAIYGQTGVKTFLISHDGEVFQKDLGERTRSIVGSLRAYDPDASWSRP